MRSSPMPKVLVPSTKTHSSLATNMFVCSVIRIWRWVAEIISLLAMNAFVCSVKSHSKVGSRDYCIRPTFQGTQFSWIAISKHFVETSFADQGFGVYSIPKFHKLNFHGLLGIRENHENYAPWKFGHIRCLVNSNKHVCLLFESWFRNPKNRN